MSNESMLTRNHRIIVFGRFSDRPENEQFLSVHVPQPERERHCRDCFFPALKLHEFLSGSLLNLQTDFASIATPD